MKKILIICTVSLFSNMSLSNTYYDSEISGYGIINDKDGYVNLRSSPELSSKVIDTINNGSVVYCYNEGGRINNFCYSQTNKGLGYIHTSRISVLENKFKSRLENDMYILYENRNKIFISTIDNHYKSICLNSYTNCIEQDKINDIQNVDIDSHEAYFDKNSGNIYLTASSGNEGNIRNIVWTINPNHAITRWDYTFEF